MSTRILLSDDHRVLLAGLRALLDTEDDLEVIGEATDGPSAVARARALGPDVVVMDIGMPGLNGIEATRQIRSGQPDTAVLALSTYADRQYVLALLEAGGSGYVLKQNVYEDLRRAVRAVASGRHFLSPDVAGWVVSAGLGQGESEDGSVFHVLGPREREVLQLLAEGHSSPEIARRLHVAASTVDTHRRNLMRKLGLHSVAELTKYAIRQGLTRLDA